MGGDITNEVLAERLDQLRRDQRDDLSRIEIQLAKLVSREVYDAHRAAADARFVALEKRADLAEAERKRAEEERQRDAKTAADKLKSLMRWWVGALILPILLTIWQVYMNTHGVVKP